MKSIRLTLITGSVIGTVAVFALSGAAIYRVARATLVRQLDEGLGERARVIASVVKYTPDGFEVEVEDINEFTSTSGGGIVEVWRAPQPPTAPDLPDLVLYRSPRLAGRDLDGSRATI